MPRPISAGRVVFHRVASHLEVLLVHPSGPFWKNKADGIWSIPKGLDRLPVACREFQEKTRLDVSGTFIELVPLQQLSGMLMLAWAVEADPDLAAFACNRVELDWPRGSGRVLNILEVDQAVYFPGSIALQKIHPGQIGFIE